MRPKLVKIDQDSEAWHEWRAGGLGSSDAAIIMGSLPYEWDDVLELWKNKVGLSNKQFQMTDAVMKGKLTEPEARHFYTQMTGLKVEPKCFERGNFRASLDGIDSKRTTVVEIKCPSISKFKMAKSGKVLDYYYTQIQHQIYASGAKLAHYFVYDTNEGGIVIKVDKNEEYIKEMVRRIDIFWNGVVTKTPIKPLDVGIDMELPFSPPQIGHMSTEVIAVYKKEESNDSRSHPLLIF